MTNQRGFTLVELLMAIVVSMVVLSAGYSIFFGSSRATTMQTQDARMQDNARMAMDVLARSFRRVGFDVKFSNYPAGTTFAPANVTYDGMTSVKLVHVDGGSNGPDAVTIVGGGAGWSACLQNTAVVQSNQITVTDASRITAGSVIGIGLTHTARVLSVSPASGAVTLDDAVGAAAWVNMEYPGVLTTNKQASPVFLVTANVFDIADDNGVPVLRQDGQPLAEGIEDLQIEYGVDVNNDRIIQDNEWTSTPDNAAIGGVTADLRDNIRLVRITIVARTDRPDPQFVGVTQDIPAIANRQARQVSDGYRRYILTRVVKCRNMDVLQTL